MIDERQLKKDLEEAGFQNESKRGIQDLGLFLTILSKHGIGLNEIKIEEHTETFTRRNERFENRLERIQNIPKSFKIKP